MGSERQGFSVGVGADIEPCLAAAARVLHGEGRTEGRIAGGHADDVRAGEQRVAVASVVATAVALGRPVAEAEGHLGVVAAAVAGIVADERAVARAAPDRHAGVDRRSLGVHVDELLERAGGVVQRGELEELGLAGGERHELARAILRQITDVDHARGVRHDHLARDDHVDATPVRGGGGRAGAGGISQVAVLGRGARRGRDAETAGGVVAREVRRDVHVEGVERDVGGAAADRQVVGQAPPEGLGRARPDRLEVVEIVERRADVEAVDAVGQGDAGGGGDPGVDRAAGVGGNKGKLRDARRGHARGHVRGVREPAAGGVHGGRVVEAEGNGGVGAGDGGLTDTPLHLRDHAAGLTGPRPAGEIDVIKDVPQGCVRRAVQSGEPSVGPDGRQAAVVLTGARSEHGHLRGGVGAARLDALGVCNAAGSCQHGQHKHILHRVLLASDRAGQRPYRQHTQNYTQHRVHPNTGTRTETSVHNHHPDSAEAGAPQSSRSG